MKKILALLLTTALLGGCSLFSIGEIRGPEFDEIIIDGTVYIRDGGDQYQSFTAADRDKFLGTVTNGSQTFRVYSIEGDPEHNYLYALWDWEGEMYVRKTLTAEE